ncbi:MAG: phosphate signaling complex protein PhoU [Verrucomicrobiota bacterium]
MKKQIEPAQRHFDQELMGLKEKLLTMGIYAERAVTQAVKALVDRDEAMANQVEQEDSLLDELEKEVDELAIKLLTEAPLATDLRLITVAMKISRNLERVGDEATTIARRVRELNKTPQFHSLVELVRMSDLAMDLLKPALDSFLNKQPELARALIPRDKAVDAIHKQVQRDMIVYLTDHPKAIAPGLNLIVISKCLERIADHATNIAEDVVFLCEACDIRHTGKAVTE